MDNYQKDRSFRNGGKGRQTKEFGQRMIKVPEITNRIKVRKTKHLGDIKRRPGANFTKKRGSGVRRISWPKKLKS